MAMEVFMSALPKIEKLNLVDKAKLDLALGDKVLFNVVLEEELGCGTIRVLSPTALRYNIESIKAIRDKLVPFVCLGYKLHTNKVVHYKCFKEILTLYSEGVHKTDSGFIKILELAYNINKDGKRRKYTLKEYIELYIGNYNPD